MVLLTFIPRMTHCAATSLKYNDKIVAPALLSSTFVPNSCFQVQCKVWNGHGFLGLYPLLLGSLSGSPHMTPKAWASHSKPATPQNSQVVCLVYPIFLTQQSRFFNHSSNLHLYRIPRDGMSSKLGWNKFPISPQDRTLFSPWLWEADCGWAGATLLPFFSSCLCQGQRVLWGVFTQCTPEPLPVCRLARRRVGAYPQNHGVIEVEKNL